MNTIFLLIVFLYSNFLHSLPSAKNIVKLDWGSNPISHVVYSLKTKSLDKNNSVKFNGKIESYYGISGWAAHKSGNKYLLCSSKDKKYYFLNGLNEALEVKRIIGQPQVYSVVNDNKTQMVNGKKCDKFKIYTAKRGNNFTIDVCSVELKSLELPEDTNKFCENVWWKVNTDIKPSFLENILLRKHVRTLSVLGNLRFESDLSLVKKVRKENLPVQLKNLTKNIVGQCNLNVESFTCLL